MIAGAICHCVDDEDIRRMEAQFADEAYAQSGQSAQTVPGGPDGAPVTRCALQAEMLRSLVETEPRAILDIGCYDGALLAEFSGRF